MNKSNNNQATPIISFRNLHKTFSSKNSTVKALVDINLDIYQSEIFGIIGLSGAGKSTLVRCINFLEKPTSGTVFFDGMDLSTLKSKELMTVRQSMGMIFQQFNLLMQRNVIDNICFPLEIIGVKREKAVKRAKELLELVGLVDKEKAYPAQLSGGQKQRVAIARALATEPKVLLCDEATSALDPQTTRSILELLKDINKKLGLTMVVITHEMSVIEAICHRLAIIDNSRIIELGTVVDIFTNPQTEVAKNFIIQDLEEEEKLIGKDLCEIIFEGNASTEPIISKTVLECKAPINIMFADTKDIDGQAFGRMIIQLPEDKILAGRVISFLKTQNVRIREVDRGV